MRTVGRWAGQRAGAATLPAPRAQAKQAALREKLEELAQDGDERARQMLRELAAQH